jgi:hypothetical protein
MPPGPVRSGWERRSTMRIRQRTNVVILRAAACPHLDSGADTVAIAGRTFALLPANAPPPDGAVNHIIPSAKDLASGR